MSQESKHIIVVSGEASGDLHAAHLVEELRRMDSRLTFSGLGGEKMKKSGVEIYYDLTPMAIIGFVEVWKHYGEIRKVFDLILKKITDTPTRAVILVDYPGFNLRLAQAVKKLTIPNLKIIYYISPQVWAWKKKRIHQIRDFTDQMLVLFQFEKEFYAKHHLDVTFVGHPLVDVVKPTRNREAILSSLELSAQSSTIGLLPGSRQKEVETILPIMIAAAAILKRKNPSLQFILCKAPTISRELIAKHVRENPLSIKIVEGNAYDGIEACDLCMVTSGTATLETAILNKPMVVIYKTSFPTWLLARCLIKIPYIGLVNIVAGKKIVPERIQFDATPEKIAEELGMIFENPARMNQIKSDLTSVKVNLGPSGASRKTAEEILKII